MATFISHSPAETEALGEQWGREAECGWVIGLSGDLGAGKTQLVKGLARALNISGRIQSPTFALINEHRGGRLPLFHVDLYRLDTREQIIGAGLEPYLIRPDGITVVEWVERWIGVRPSPVAATSNVRESLDNFDASGASHAAATGDGRTPGRFRHAFLKSLSETEREIQYEDFGR